MKNIDKYRELIEKERQKESILIGLVNGIPVNCREIDSCAQCGFFDGNPKACIIDFINWMFEEAEPAEEQEPQKEIDKMIPTHEEVVKALAEVTKETEKLPPRLALPLMAKLFSDYINRKDIPRYIAMAWFQSVLRADEESVIANKLMKDIESCGKKPMNS